MKVTLTYVNNEDKVSKNGKSYKSCSIKCEEFGDAWINGYGNYETQDWQVGDRVDVFIYDNHYNGNVYKNFKTIHPTVRLQAVVTAMFNVLVAKNLVESQAFVDTVNAEVEKEMEKKYGQPKAAVAQSTPAAPATTPTHEEIASDLPF